MTLREHNILVCLMENKDMATILSILGMVSQLKNLFGSSGSSSSYFSSYPTIAQNYGNDVQGWLGVPFKK